MPQRKFYITTAIDYVNSLPHLGTAYEKIGADALARFRRRMGDRVIFQMGNDEHSINVYKAAQKKGLDPKTYCDQMREQFEAVWKALHISYDGFIQTSEPRHHQAVQELFKKIDAAGDIYQGRYEGWYCESCEAYYTEKDLVDDQCPHHKSKPKWIQQENYFFRLSRFQQPLLDHYQKHPDFILPAIRRNEMIRLIESGLQDVSVSRADIPWGVPLPNNDQEVVYVWFDALINYLTAIGYPDDSARYNEQWPADIHVIGKDITRFHCVIWPAMLMSAGLPLPKRVFGHGFVYLKGEKMSKTLGNIVTPLDIIPRYGADPLRYYLLAESSFGSDGDFTWEGFIKRYNADLANDLGNLLNRTIGMTQKYLNGIITSSPQVNLDGESALINNFETTKQKIEAAMDPSTGDFQTHQALAALWSFLGEVDKYIDHEAPWTLYKEGKKERIAEVLYHCTAALRIAALFLEPFMPQTAYTLWERLGLSQDDFQKERYDQLQWEDLKTPITLNMGDPLFPRIDDQPPKKEETMSEPENATTNQITIDDFFKTELKIARVITAERIEGADRLLRLEVELETEKRQLVAGIAKQYEPDQLIGKQVVIVANLKPAKLRGVESQGMILCANGADGPVLLSPEIEVPNGSPVK